MEDGFMPIIPLLLLFPTVVCNMKKIDNDDGSGDGLNHS